MLCTKGFGSDWHLNNSVCFTVMYIQYTGDLLNQVRATVAELGLRAGNEKLNTKNKERNVYF
jgi:hypothetical protein